MRKSGGDGELGGDGLLLAVPRQTGRAGHRQLDQVLLVLRLVDLLPAVAPHLVLLVDAGPRVVRLAALQLVSVGQQHRGFINDFLRLRPGCDEAGPGGAAGPVGQQHLGVRVGVRVLGGTAVVFRGETGLTEAHHAAVSDVAPSRPGSGTVVTLSILTNMEIPFPIPELYKHNIELAVVRAEIKTGPPPLPPAESK